MDIKYLLGLIDGEGNFGNHIVNHHQKNKNGEDKIYPVRHIKFQICMHIRDFPLLKKIETFLNMGSARLYGSCAKYVISNRTDLDKFIKIIDNNGGFIGYKNEQYLVWKKERE